MDKVLPKEVKAVLWSFNTDKIDYQKNKKQIITNVLNFGTEKAIQWLFDNYNKEEILAEVKNPIPGQWNKKSLNFWSIIFGVDPIIKNRF